MRNPHDTEGLPTVHAESDTIVSAGSVHNVKVPGPFTGRSDWLIEKVLIGMEDTSILAAPMTWINSDNPYIPIANPSPHPWFIKEGDVVGHLIEPSSLDNPTSEQEETDRRLHQKTNTRNSESPRHGLWVPK